MKIAVIGNFDKEISIAASGGTEVFTYTLVSGLAKLESVTSIDVYGVGKDNFNHPKINYKSILPLPMREFVESNPIMKKASAERPDFLTSVQFNIGLKVFQELRKNNYDIIHNNSTLSVFNGLAGALRSNMVTTIHTNIQSPSIIIPYYVGLLTDEKKQYFVTIANHQKNFARENNIDINIAANVYNGIDVNAFTFSDTTKQNGYGFWIGRASRKHNKGLKEAVMATKKINVPLNAVVSIDDTEFFEKEISPEVHSKATVMAHGSIDFKKKSELYRDASYFLYPIMWEEPFGLIFLEAMASGTPVIAFAKGAVPEIIKDGETGFIVNSSDEDKRGDWIVRKTGIDGLCEAIQKIQSLTDEEYKKMRHNCRAHVENHFTVDRMVADYEKVYTQIIAKSK